jgi:hypothetical protein
LIIEMATVTLDTFMTSAGLPKVFVAGMVVRPTLSPSTKAIPQTRLISPGPVMVKGGMKSSATKEPFGHVRVSTYKKGMAGMDAMGFMT